MRTLVAAGLVCLVVAPTGAQPPAPLTAIRAGRLLDPEAGRILTNQIILVEGTRIRDVGPNVQVPANARVVDLSAMTVLPGLVDAHNHLALTYKPEPESNIYYFTYVQESTALRAIQAASNGIQMLASGFTIVRDMGNNALYADTALRQAIEQGWIPGPTIINSGIIIGGLGGQFFPTPEMAKQHNIVYPEYLDADTNDEIIKAVRQNVLFGARVIKICVDCKPYGYTADEIRLFIREAAKVGMKVEGHVQTVNGAKNAIEAGIWSIAHTGGLNEEMHKLMAQKGIWRAGTETPDNLAGHPVSPQAYQRTLASLKNAYELKVPLTFSTDADYYVAGKTRGEVCMEFLKVWKDAGIPNTDILRAMTINGYKVSETEKTRGPIKAGLIADLIAVPGNPLDDIMALKTVQFVMKDGEVFKKDGIMVPEKFFHGGPVNGWRIR
ncbi:MAG TPA: amidohydrolase family protein [Vicinamibacterales bacterium]|jgi:imidazolonepropionase-like amidohydrolase|nr:amidohydrolase family protein [Vicinamibacterales bacterium]